MRGRRLIAALVWFVAAAGGVAAQTDGPLMGSSASEADQVQPQGDAQQILVIGDTLGGGLGAGLTRLSEADPSFEVTIRFVEESGIARPEVYDWSETLAKLLEGRTYGVVVVMMGANDRQMMKTDYLRFPFNSEGWSAAYKAQLDKVLEVLAASGAQVYWVSLPPMADPDYDQAMQAVAALQRQRVEARGMTYVDIRKAFLGPGGSYTDTGPDDTGEIHKLRSRDGVTFFKQGNNRLAQLVLAAIKAGPKVAAAVAEVTKTGGSDPLASAPSMERQADLPMFGQADVSGAAIEVKPDRVLESLARQLAAGAAADLPSVRELMTMAAPGSAAEQLFAQGTPGAAPAGRVDDFSLPPPAQP